MKNYDGTQPTEREDKYSTTLEDFSDTFELVVWNDDVNTFDWVIETLIDICFHEREQAEQCALLIHFKGKCTVKSGDYETLKTMKNEIVDRGINATIESHAS